MKKILPVIFLILNHFLAYAQKSDSTHTHYAFYRGFSSHVTELKSKRGILNGEYIIFNGKSVGAIGLYKNNERVGRWQFFFAKDSLEQIYNYTTKTVEFNLPNKNISFLFDSLKDGDKVLYPSKIAGSLGLFLLIQHYQVPYEARNSSGQFNVSYIFTLNKEGKLMKYEIKTTALNFSKVVEINLKKLKPEDFDFSPAKVNGKNVSCVMVVDGKLNANLNR